MGKTAKQRIQSQRGKDHTYQRFKGSKNEGQGFANVRKSQAVSRYYRDFAKEKANLKGWTEKLQKIYAESDNSSDDDKLVKVHVKRNGSANDQDTSQSHKIVSGVRQLKEQSTVKKKISTITSRSVLLQSASSDAQDNGPQRCNKSLKVSSYFKEEQEWKKKAKEKDLRLQEIELKKKAKETAIAKHRQDKIHNHKLLAKRNYKGQPNMATRMELLLEKIVKKTS